MNLATLILETFRTKLADDPDRQGFRLSPVAITRADAQEIAAGVERLGRDVFLVVSAPDVPILDRPRVFMAPDESAAERATLWRNTVRPSSGGHLLYVSAEEHDKASGLAGLLSEVRDEDIARTFVNLCESQDSGLPPGTGEALRDSGILDRVPADSLCEFAAAVRKATKGVEPRSSEAWEIVGQNLPLLSLAQDTALRRQNAQERISANHKMVSRAQAAERRHRNGSGATSSIEANLRDRLAQAPPEVRQRALSAVDLGTVLTTQLRGAPKKGSRASAAKQRKLPLRAPSKEPKPRPSVSPLPSGLAAMLDSLHRGTGAQVSWKVRGDARQCLARMPGGALSRPAAFDMSSLPREQISAWQTARAGFLAALVEHMGPDGITHLVRNPIQLLAHDAVSASATELITAASALYSASGRGDPDAAAAVLSFDTVSIIDDRGTSLLLVGPLHPLWLYQANLASRALGSASEGPLALDLLRRSLEAPAAASTWPLVDGEPLLLGRAEAHLIVYQREPDSVGASALRGLGKALLERYLELCPHARLSTRIAIVNGDPSELINGMAEFVSGQGDSPEGLRHLQVATNRIPTLGSAASEAQAAGTLLVTGLPDGDAALFTSRPHVVIRFAPAAATMEDAVPGLPSATADVGGGLLRTVFYIDAHGLQARTQLTGHPPLEAVETLHAAARRRAARHEFITDSRAVSLTSVLPSGDCPVATWHVALGARLGGQPPRDHRLLVHEAIDVSASCAVATREVRPAARAVAEGLALLRIDEDRPKMLSMIANRLATASSSGLLSLRHEGSQLIAAGVLALELRRRLGERTPAVITQLDGVHYGAIVGERAEMDRAGAVIIGVSSPAGKLAVTVGYASLDGAADVRVERRGLTGRIARRLERVVRVFQLSSDDTPIGNAAREALSWFLWPAMAAQEITDRRLGEALRRWADGAPIDLSVVCLLAPTVLPGRDKAARVGGVPVTFVGFNADLVNRLVLHA
jgi:hypothetical protein